MKNLHNWANTLLIVVVGVLVLVGGNNSTSNLGGHTDDNWDVGGNLTVAGTSSITGTQTGATTTVEAFTQGGCRMATSTSDLTNNLTLTASETQTCRYWDITPNRIEQTLTLPASSSITTLVPNTGDVATIWVRNATGTASTMRIAAGTGWTIQTASTTPASVASTTAGEWSRMTVIRKADTDIDVLFEFFK